MRHVARTAFPFKVSLAPFADYRPSNAFSIDPRHASLTRHSPNSFLRDNAFVLLLHNFLSIRFSSQISSSSNFCPRKFFLRRFLRISAQRLDSFKVHVTAIRCYISLSSFNLNLCPFDFAKNFLLFLLEKKYRVSNVTFSGLRINSMDTNSIPFYDFARLKYNRRIQVSEKNWTN